MNKILPGIFLTIIIFTGCMKEDKNICNYDPCELKAPDAEITAVETYLDGKGITSASMHCSGMFYEISAPGSSEKPQDLCTSVGVKYRGWFTNGAGFDSSVNGTTLQLGNLIEGWKKGIPLVGRNGKIRLYVPPSLAYGDEDYRNNRGEVAIPANSILIFDIELVDFR